MRSSKAELYAHELHEARMLGAWEVAPAAAPAQAGRKSEHARPGSIPELVRKCVKHNSVSGSEADLALAENGLRSLLLSFWRSQDWNARSHAADFARPGHEGLTAVPPNVPESGAGPGWSADKFTAVTSHLDTLQKHAQGEIQSFTATALLAYAYLNAGRDEDAVLLLHEVKLIETLQVEELRTEAHTDDYNVVLLILGFVVYGMANERLHAADSSAGYAPFAFAGYTRAIDMYDGVRGTLKSGKIDEMDRWGELALYRNALMSVRESETYLGLNALRAYQTHAVRWPATFRPTQRSVIYRTYLEVLNRTVIQRSYLPPPITPQSGQHDPRSQVYQIKVVQTVAARVPIISRAASREKRGAFPLVRAGWTARSVVSRTISTRRPHPDAALRPGFMVWGDEAYTVATRVSTVVPQSSDFPHADRTNVLALELADALMTSWKLSGQSGGFVADDLVQTLYAMTRITFDSHLITRSLLEALTVAEQYEEAERALKLYVELVEKTREAAEAEKKNARKVDGEGVTASEASAPSVNKFDDHDDGETYARTLIYGAWVLGKCLSKYTEADKLARRAVEVLETDDELAAPSENAEEEVKLAYAGLVALVKRGAGVARSALATVQTDPTKRETLHKEALSLLVDSAKLDTQAAETYYYLARLQAQLHDIPAATASARKAVELEPAAIEPWHLLALLLSSKKDYKAALRIASVALDQAEKDAAHDREVASQESFIAESGQQHEIPDAIELRTELLSYDFPPAHTERDEKVLQLLITHNALEELVVGTAAAIDGQKDIFVYFHNYVASDATQRLGSTVKGSVPKTARAQLQIDTHPPGFFHRRGSRFASLLHHGPGQHHHGPRHHHWFHADNDGTGAYSTITGLGQSGVMAAPASTVFVSAPDEAASPVAAPPPIAVDPGALAASRHKAGYTPATFVRLIQRSRTEAKLLARIWLMSAATFRRAGQLADCRVAIQEAERAVPDLPGVWTQLGLYHAENDRLTPATNCLYKALACDPQAVPAAVHLARLLLSRPNEVPAASSNAAVKAQFSTPAQSRSIAAPLHENGTTEINAEPEEHSKEAPQLSPATSGSTALSLAEALLTSVTAGSGWDVSEAWLYLGRVTQQTHRPERAVECLKYALWLEQTKPVRSLGEALALSLP